MRDECVENLVFAFGEMNQTYSVVFRDIRDISLTIRSLMALQKGITNINCEKIRKAKGSKINI